MRFYFVFAVSALPFCSALALWPSIRDDSDPSSLTSECDTAGIDANMTINSDFNNCLLACGDPVITATQDALAAYNNTAGNTPTTDPTDPSFLDWAQENSPEYNDAVGNCAGEVQALNQAISDAEATGGLHPATTVIPGTDDSSTAVPGNDGSSTQASGSASSTSHTSVNSSAKSSGSPTHTSSSATGPASPTRSGNGADVLSKSSWLAAFGAAVVFIA